MTYVRGAVVAASLVASPSAATGAAVSAGLAGVAGSWWSDGSIKRRSRLREPSEAMKYLGTDLGRSKARQGEGKARGRVRGKREGKGKRVR